MDDGLIQLLFIAFFVIVSMMDGAARKRRKEAKLMEGHQSESDWIPEGAHGEADEGSVDMADSPETLAPQDLWKEIAALARGEAPASRGERTAGASSSSYEPGSGGEEWAPAAEELSEGRVPKSERASLSRRSAPVDLYVPETIGSGDLQAGYLHPDQAVTHGEHAQIGPLERPLPPDTPHQFVPHSLQPSSGEQQRHTQARQPGSLLSGVRRGARSSLREAIVLAEVLNQPIALRDSDTGPLGRS